MDSFQQLALPCLYGARGGAGGRADSSQEDFAYCYICFESKTGEFAQERQTGVIEHVF
jgi:hypothetical protein